MDPLPLLALASRLARAAAHAIEAIRAAGYAVDEKRDGSPVTEADRVAEALIVEGLRAATPEIPVVAEEEVAGGRLTDCGDLAWMVDPLDGTREFAAGRLEFTVNIGLIRLGRPWLGAVAIPARGEVFRGIIGLGAWKEDAAGDRAIFARKPPAEGITVLASRHYQDDPNLPRFLEGRHVAKIIHIGSAEKFCRIAEGVADLYPRFGPTMEWDTAAPEAVLIAAGGRVLGLDGMALAYGKPGYLNPPFVASGA